MERRRQIRGCLPQTLHQSSQLSLCLVAFFVVVQLALPRAHAHEATGGHTCIHDLLTPHEHHFSGRRHLQQYAPLQSPHGASRRLQGGTVNSSDVPYRNPRDGRPLRIATELRVQAGTLSSNHVRWLKQILIPMATDWWQQALQVRERGVTASGRGFPPEQNSPSRRRCGGWSQPDRPIVGVHGQASLISPACLPQVSPVEGNLTFSTSAPCGQSVRSWSDRPAFKSRTGRGA